MALDGGYFDSIYIEVVKKKYYKASKVQAVFAEIRQQAEALNEENRSLRQRLQEQESRKAELGGVMLSAQDVYQDILEQAKKKAAVITAEAEQQSEEILARAREESEKMLSRSREREQNAAQLVEQALERMKRIHQDSMAALDAQWQDFLCSLEPEPRELPGPAEGTETPPDLEEKVGAIAAEIFALEE